MSNLNDRRRINGPSGGTAPPMFAAALGKSDKSQRPERTRQPNQLRKIFLQTGLTPSASGSAYLELGPEETSSTRTTSLISQHTSLIPQKSSLKLTCAVHGPRPLPRSAPFSPQLLLSAQVKFTPFASRQRRGYIRDAGERDLGVHLESALRGLIIGDRWPKSGVEVIVTVLEGEEDRWWGDDAGPTGQGGIGGWGMMTVLAGCITVASAAIAEAGIDCVDMVTGGVAALVAKPGSQPRQAASQAHGNANTQIVLDPCPAEHEEIIAAAVVAYLASRDEVTEVWMKGEVGTEPDALMEGAVEAAKAARTVLAAVIRGSEESKDVDGGDGTGGGVKKGSMAPEVEMTG